MWSSVLSYISFDVVPFTDMCLMLVYTEVYRHLSFFSEKPPCGKKYYIGTNAVHVPKSNMEIINPIKDGMSE